MTKEEAKDVLEEIKELDDSIYQWNTKYLKALDMAIQALEQEPCEDAISRREAIKIFTYNYKGERIPDYDCDNFPVQIAVKKVKKMLRELPPVKPQERTGHWIEKMDACECPYCHKAWDYYDNDTEDFEYCPKCGAKLSENPTGSEPQKRSK